MFVFVKKLDLTKWMGFKGKPSAVRGAAGWTKTTGPHGEVINCDTLQCSHCGAHWEVVVGSGKLRGFCSRCYDSNKPGTGYTCGRPECMVCLTPEQRLENIEAGKSELTPHAPKILVPSLKDVENFSK